jgi:hypothetical protein
MLTTVRRTCLMGGGSACARWLSLLWDERGTTVVGWASYPSNARGTVGIEHRAGNDNGGGEGMWKGMRGRVRSERGSDFGCA